MNIWKNFRTALLHSVLVCMLGILPAVSQAATDINTYYLDLDQDSFGSKAVSIQSNSPVPPNRLWTSWGNDPEDHDPYKFPVPSPKGDRILGLDFADGAETGEWRADLASELGVEAVPLHLLWNLLESAPNTFEGLQHAALDIANASYVAQGLKLSLTISPISGAFLTVPTDLRLRLNNGQIRFNDPEFINRFNALLTFAHAQLPNAQLTSLQIGNDVDEFFATKNDLQFWIDFYEFFQAASAHAKSLWGNTLKVGITATFSGLVNEPTRSLMSNINGSSDMLSVTYLPRSSTFNVIEPINVENDIWQLISVYGAKPIYFQSVGFPSTPQSSSSQVKQSQFIKSFFDAWDRFREMVPFASFSSLHDLSPTRASIDASSYNSPGVPVPVISSYLETLGLRTYAGSGTNKAAYNTLRNMAFERGWWRIAPAKTRSFYLGFTPSPYDLPSDMQGKMDVASYIDNKISTEADITAIHMDGGVPWVEAYTDTFQSSELPYSGSLKAAWLNYKNRIPKTHKVLVSISPLGIPRNLLAPYWGYGESFDYTADYNRVGTGVYADDENRLPPPPWNSYNFDDMQVKVAFLNYAKRALQYFHPDYLCIAIEVSANQVSDYTRYPKFLELHKYVYQQLKLIPEYSHVKILVSFSATSYMTDEYGPLVADWNVENGVTWKYDEMAAGIRPRLIQGFKDILPYTDMIGLSLYPHFGKYNAYTLPASMYDGLYDMLAQAGIGNKPIAITESGYAAEQYNIFTLLFTGDHEKQDRYYKLLFYELEKHDTPVEFVISFKVRDSDQVWQRQKDAGINPTFLEFYKYFRNIGLYTSDGLPRPAAATWNSEFALPRLKKGTENRSFNMGFSSHTPAETPEGYSAAYNILRDHADLTSHVFNEGVPWIEALNSDNYTSYPANLQETWNKRQQYFDLALPDHKRYLLLNPIVTTYDGLAPYWGERPNLPLPAPWNNYQFDHPDVKRSFANYVCAAISFFQPSYVAINIEANILLANKPTAWSSFKELNQYVYNVVKTRFPGIKVLSTIQYEHMLGLHSASAQLKALTLETYPNVLQNEVKSLMEFSDLFAVSTYPYMVTGNLVRDDYYDVAFQLAAEINKPIAVDQTGYTTTDLINIDKGYYLPGSFSLQNNYLSFFLQKLQQHNAQFIINFVGVDYGANYGLDFTMLNWAFTGLRNLDGSDKPALTIWDSYFRLPYTTVP